ncbi:PIN domain-containing protein [Enterovirga sp. DB1703]|uniref:Ribonuclease VapC n=2 Tax=Enterovirga aerilata TaxID=2730920 RepID=A0A849IDT2_9HYPH|nr:PIN domain-containing protein [Enterovirga sp. DB1703]
MLDTDTLIRLRRRQPAALMKRLAGLNRADAVVSVVSYGELRVGAEKSNRRADALATLETLMTLVTLAPVPTVAAIDYGEIRSHRERHGQLIGPNDLWIAAHARSAGLTLVTDNEREFRRVPGLAVENWAAAA